MAGTVPDFSLPTPSFFNIFNDAPPAIAASPNLPGGPCNFVDMSRDGQGPKCGCRRFWSRSAFAARTGGGSPAGTSPGFANGFSNGNTGGLTDDATWCMCSHHACFHDDIRNDQQLPIAVTANIDAVNNGQENERPRANREPLTPVMPDLPFKLPAPTEPNMDFYTFNEADSFSTHLEDRDNAPQNEVAAPAPEPSIPDTLSWNDFIQSGPEGANLLPPIPSQCLMSSQPSSTTSSTKIGYLRPFAGKGLETLSGAKSKLCQPPLEQDDIQPEDTAAASMDYIVDEEQTIANTPRSCRHEDMTARHSLSPPGPSQDRFRQLSDTIQSHEQRLDKLENPSISAASHDGCDEKHDQSDLRITELESRVEEVEKMINDNSSQTSNHRHGRHMGVDVSTSSVMSVSTEGSEGVASCAELYSQLQALRSQLSQLQGLSSFTSYSRPWEVEVIFLPFPLKSVWVESHSFASQRMSGASSVEPDQWTQMPSSYSTFEPQSPAFSDWAGPELESDWLLPRAFAPDRVIEQRLRSRGLVKNVTIRSPDARSVHQAISEAFGTLFRTFSRMQANVHHGSTQHHRVAKFLGLQSPWVPLRKVHRDSRLRFLSPSEMVTPVTWDVSFLRSSVVMKATGVQRLFITHPEAYLQDQDAYDNGWNWQRLRELSRVYADSQSSQEVPEADAMEDCWGWNDKLDEHAASTNTSQSLSLRQAAQRNWRATSMSPAQNLLISATAISPSLGTHRSVSRAKSPAILRERKPSRPPHLRTASMPPTAVSVPSPAKAKRRQTSYVHQYERRPSPQVIRVVPTIGHIAGLAKRRSTRSPSVRQRITPRWSTASPTPVPEIYVGRPLTPFYATPYSNAPYVEARNSRSIPNIDEGDDVGESGSGTEPNEEEGEYMDEDQDEYSENNDNDSPMIDFTHQDSQESWQDGQLHSRPEDEPWLGIEDAENRDPNHIISIHVDDDAMSDADDLGNESQRSSVPSEYPSTQRAWIDAEEAIRVYEDGDEGPTGNGSGAGK
ncbi:uncharacterized protein F4822DRAFT_205109 [Hypoxylon trugodes]|uniref:uncharacterized protein n=1 Tax=Hypoxylon trugodes TaxID=326681 RepID=UPI00218F2521|nr:uncharacterized protein F4822DRAFT_205109 [Hypoxylon trugodes]KAI1389564.1 hypothetical protein F4822DRAFT_205109 [Hypoxylon trugodes]